MDTMSKSSTQVAERELFIERIFNAPVELVWQAWTDPEQVKRWWGPQDFTAPVVKIDFKVGGKYFYCMRSPEGQDYYSTGFYREIVPLERIVCTDCFADENGNVVPATHYGMGPDIPLELLITVTFEDLEGRTKLTLRHRGFPPGEMKDLCEVGWNQSFDKLADSLR